jgi:hypothetical protein
MKQFISALCLALGLVLPVTCFSYNFVIVMKDGREIAVDTYGYQGTRVVLHRDGRLLETSRDSVKEIRRLRGESGESRPSGNTYDQPGREEVFNLGRAIFSAFDKGYISSLGRASLEQEMAWLEQILIPDQETPGSSSGPHLGFCARWTNSPTLSVFNGLGAGNRAVEKALREANQALASTPIRIIALTPNDTSAQIKIRFGLAEEFPPEPSLDTFPSDGRSYIRGVTREVPRIESADIWIATDRAGKKEMEFLSKGESLAVSRILQQRHYERVVLHELMHALGLSHSSIFPDSIMYCQIIDKNPLGNGRTFLSSRDKKAVEFLYNNVQPGWDREELRKEAEKHWLDFLP